MTPKKPDGPLLSIVVCTERFETLRPLLSHLEGQASAERLELVIACPSERELGLDRGREAALARVVVVEHADPDGGFINLAAARAAGVRAAGAPLVVLAETHCFPAPGWAEALIEAHGTGRSAAVGPVILNANPATAVSWAGLISDYGPWVAPAEGGLRDELPGHNSCYRREELLAYGPRLGEMLSYEASMHHDMRGRGRELALAGTARVRHLNVSALRDWPRERYVAGRAFASARSSQWSPWRRLLYVLGGPLIPIVRLRRLAPMARRARGRPSLVRLIPTLAGALVIQTVGEVAGFAAGPGRSWRTVARLEIYKERSVRPSERPQPV